MTRTDNTLLFRNCSASRCALLDDRARGMRASQTRARCCVLRLDAALVVRDIDVVLDRAREAPL